MTRAHIIDALKKKNGVASLSDEDFQRASASITRFCQETNFSSNPTNLGQKKCNWLPFSLSFFFLPFCPQSPLLPSIRSDWCSCFLILTLLSRKEKWFLSCASFFALLPVEIASYVRNLFICASNPRAKNRFCVVAAENARPASADDAASVLASGGEETNGTSCEIRHHETDWVW